jgi:hypothetical protein
MRSPSAATVAVTLAQGDAVAPQEPPTRPAAQEVLAPSVRDAGSIRQDWVSIVMGNSCPHADQVPV